MAMIEPGSTFKANLEQLPPIDHLERVDLIDTEGAVIASVPNQPGKQGSLAVYHYLAQLFGRLDVKAAEHGLLVFAEHTLDARNRPGAHPNIDRLLAIAVAGNSFGMKLIAAER